MEKILKKTTKQTYAIYWQHVRKYRLLGLAMVLALTGAVILSIVMPIFYKQFFDLLTGELTDKTAVATDLLEIIFIVLGLNGLQWLFYRVCSYGNNYFQPKIISDLAHTCFTYLHNHSYKFFINRFTGSLVRRVNRFVDAFEGVADKIYWDIWPDIVRISAIIMVLFYFRPIIALIILIWVIIYTIISYIFALYKYKYEAQEAEIDSEVTGNLADTITNNINLKLFTSFKKETKRHDGLLLKLFKMQRLTWNLSAHMETVQGALMAILEFLVFYFAIRFWQQGLITVGDFVLYQTYLLSIFIHLWNLGRVIRDLYHRLADAEEMTQVLNTPYEVKDKPRAKELEINKGKIEFQNVHFSYTKTRLILKDLNLDITPEEKVGLVGPSGAGKTTIAALLFRLFDLQGGKILIDGQNIADVTQESLRQNISLVPQDPILFHRTLMENIRYGQMDASCKEAVKAAKLAHCDDFIKELPEKYQTHVGERGIKLSGGERQRVAIARAILKDAPILVLDEATSSLDSHSELLIQDALAKLMKGKTAIVIAHRLSTLLKMDRIIVIDKQGIIESGSHQQLLRKPRGLYRRLWKLQAGGFIQ